MAVKPTPTARGRMLTSVPKHRAPPPHQAIYGPLSAPTVKNVLHIQLLNLITVSSPLNI